LSIGVATDDFESVSLEIGSVRFLFMVGLHALSRD
jgi:hypothetical protein